MWNVGRNVLLCQIFAGWSAHCLWQRWQDGKGLGSTEQGVCPHILWARRVCRVRVISQHIIIGDEWFGGDKMQMSWCIDCTLENSVKWSNVDSVSCRWRQKFQMTVAMTLKESCACTCADILFAMWLARLSRFAVKPNACLGFIRHSFVCTCRLTGDCRVDKWKMT